MFFFNYLLVLIYYFNEIKPIATQKILYYRLTQEDFLPNKVECEEIKTPFCKNLPYNQTSKINLLGNVDQKLLTNEISKYEQLYKLNCSSFFELFICSYYLPLCSIKSLLPCKELCLKVKDDCQSILNEKKIEWPENLICSNFPTFKHTQMCFLPKNLDNRNYLETIKPNKNNLNKNLMINRKNKEENNEKFNDNFTCPIELRKPFNNKYVFKIANTEYKGCTFPCHNFLYTSDEYSTTRLIISYLCFFTLVINLIFITKYNFNKNNYEYPSKAVVYISYCYLVISFMYGLGFVLKDLISCDESSDLKISQIKTLSIGSEKFSCQLSFAVINFFTTASLVWWIILNITFFLQMVLAWGKEHIEEKHKFFHICAWTISFLHTILIIIKNNIEGDPISGLCTVRTDEKFKNLILFQVILLSIGFLIFFYSFIYFIKIIDFLKSNYKMNESRIFIEYLIIFIFSFFLAYLAQIAIQQYEIYNVDIWTQNWYKKICEKRPKDRDKCPSWIINLNLDENNFKPTLYFLILKYSFYMIPGLVSSTIVLYDKIN